jgi:hypothetical protein
MNIPDSIECAQCGAPIRWDDSFGLSVPMPEFNKRKIKASDFCCLSCLADWTAEVASLTTGKTSLQ